MLCLAGLELGAARLSCGCYDHSATRVPGPLAHDPPPVPLQWSRRRCRCWGAKSSTRTRPCSRTASSGSRASASRRGTARGTGCGSAWSRFRGWIPRWADVWSRPIRSAQCGPKEFYIPGETGCRECVAGAVCEGATLQRIKTQADHWRAHPDSGVFLKCPAAGACLANRTRGACAEGHTGFLCGVCEEGYADTDCSACSEDSPALKLVVFCHRVLHDLWVCARAACLGWTPLVNRRCAHSRMDFCSTSHFIHQLTVGSALVRPSTPGS